MSAYPVVYDQKPPVKRSRLTVFFRILLAIPHFIWLSLYGIGAYVVAIIAWFALLFTGKYPAGMYNFLAGFIRYSTRVNAYSYLIVDEYPPFDGGEHSEYPVRIKIGPPQAKYNRVLVFFRFILVIPVVVLLYVFAIWIEAVSIAIWFVAVIMGKTGPGLTDAVRFPMSYSARAGAYMFLLTDTFPPVSETQTLPQFSQPVA